MVYLITLQLVKFGWKSGRRLQCDLAVWLNKSGHTMLLGCGHSSQCEGHFHRVPRPLRSAMLRSARNKPLPASVNLSARWPCLYICGNFESKCWLHDGNCHHDYNCIVSFSDSVSGEKLRGVSERSDSAYLLSLLGDDSWPV